jgi:hypothetical protein
MEDGTPDEAIIRHLISVLEDIRTLCNSELGNKSADVSERMVYKRAKLIKALQNDHPFKDWNAFTEWFWKDNPTNYRGLQKDGKIVPFLRDFVHTSRCTEEHIDALLGLVKE